MHRFLILLLSLAAIALPIQARATGIDCCGTQGEAQIASEAEALAGDSCCGGDAGHETPGDQGDDRREDHRGPCNDCPRPCCSAPLIVPAPSNASRPKLSHAPVVVARPAELGARRAAHLDRLDRPPRPPFRLS